MDSRFRGNDGIVSMCYPKKYYVYILTSSKNGTLYIGITNNLIERVHQHKVKMKPGFTEKYNVDKLVYYEIYGDSGRAITREKQMKKWRRDWKIALIQKENPE